MKKNNIADPDHLVTFSSALDYLIHGYKIRRDNWPADAWLFLLPDMMDRQITLKNVIVLNFGDDEYNVWSPTQGDLLSDNWQCKEPY